MTLLELKGKSVPGDVEHLFEQRKLARTAPVVQARRVKGCAEEPPDNDGDDAEVAADVQLTAAAAPEATLEVVFAPATDDGWAAAFAEAAFPRPCCAAGAWPRPT